MIGSLTLDQLTVLVTIVETGSFSAAGKKLGRVQSAISTSVQSLEKMQQIQLFDRSGKIPRLTEAGSALVVQAQQVLKQAELFERTANAIASGLEPELTLAVDSMVQTEPLLRSLAGLQATFPNLAVTLYTESIGAAERRAREGSAAIALCALMPASAQELQTHRLTTVNLVTVTAPNHPLVHETRPLSREILAEHVQLVLTDPVDPSGPSYSVVSPRIWRFVDMLRRLEFLLGGFGWCTMPLHLVADHLADEKLVRLDIDDPGVLPGSIPIFAVHARNRQLGVAGRWLLHDLINQRW